MLARSRVLPLLLTALLALAGPAAAQTQTPPPRTQLVAHADTRFTLSTGIANGKMVFIGKGGAIDGQINPTLTVPEGAVVQITLINGEGAEHDIALPDLHVASQRVIGPGASSALVFRAADIGTFVYFCTVPGHRAAGMEGVVKVEPAAVHPSGTAAASVSRDPADLPPPLAVREPQVVHYSLEAIERVGRLDDGATYDFWTFNGRIPGPMLRVRVGDTVVLTLKNARDSIMWHNIDLHAVSGPGGGAMLSEVAPGESKTFSFKALHPGLFVYHCATPMVANHISNGMYGMILVEPVGGLPKVDREFYVMQGELYTTGHFGDFGKQEFSADKLLNERPEYFLFNGGVGALTKEHPLHAKVGEHIRVFFGVGGPNFTSSFHIIGTVFDHAYTAGSLTSPPLTDVQTVSVPPGGATVVDLSLPTPGRFLLVDHALGRMERGLLGALLVKGTGDPAIFRAGPPR